MSVPLRVRIGLATGSTLCALGLGEGAVRLADRGALPQLAIFTTAADGRIVLAPEERARVRRPDGGVYTVATDERGFRAGPAASGGWLLVGDSQAFGLGVADDETFAARLGMSNAGVPAYGVPDVLAQAEAHAPHGGGVLVLVDEANDWDDGLRPASERYRVRSGWLLTPETAEGLGGALWSTPLARAHLFYVGWTRVRGAPDVSGTGGPAWLDPSGLGELTAAFAAAIRAFAAAHPDLRTVVAFLPVDAATSAERAALSPFAVGARTPWTDTTLRDTLRTALAEVPMIDLLPALRDPGSFLERDFHLSADGHARVAALLAKELAP